MKKYYIGDNCLGCSACVSGCPAEAISRKENLQYRIDQGKCIGCGHCLSVCNYDVPQPVEV